MLPDSGGRAQANATAALYEEADADREAFWARQVASTGGSGEE